MKRKSSAQIFIPDTGIRWAVERGGEQRIRFRERMREAEEACLSSWEQWKELEKEWETKRGRKQKER